MDHLDGDAESCDEGVELLVTKHPKIKEIKIGKLVMFATIITFDTINIGNGNINITDRGLQALLTADGLTKLSLSRAHLIIGETLGLHSNSTQNIQHLALINCSLTDKGILKIMDTCGIQLTSLDVVLV